MALAFPCEGRGTACGGWVVKNEFKSRTPHPSAVADTFSRWRRLIVTTTLGWKILFAFYTKRALPQKAGSSPRMPCERIRGTLYSRAVSYLRFTAPNVLISASRQVNWGAEREVCKPLWTLLRTPLNWCGSLYTFITHTAAYDLFFSLFWKKA